MKEEAVGTDKDVLWMTNERFSVPETLFRPSDIGEQLTGLVECGVAGVVADSIMSLREDIQGLFWANVGVVGGNTQFSGFRERL